MSRRRRAKPVQLSLPPVEAEKRGKINIGPVIFLILIVCAACAIYLWFSSGVNGSVRSPIHPVGAVITSVAASAGKFQATVENRNPAPGPAPKGMVWIPAGEFSMGANGLGRRISSQGKMAGEYPSRTLHGHRRGRTSGCMLGMGRPSLV